MGDIPLIVLAAGIGLVETMPDYEREEFGLTPEDTARSDAIWRDLQEDHVTRSTDGRLVVAETHSIYFDEPDVVVEAIHDLTTTE